MSAYDPSRPANCLAVFKSNCDAGLILFAALVLDAFAQRLAWLAARDFVVLCEDTLEVVEFRARDETDALQCRELLLGFGSVAEHQICFAEMLMGAAVPRIERRRPPVVPERRVQLPQTAVGVTEIVLDIGIAVVAQAGRRKRCDCAEFPERYGIFFTGFGSRLNSRAALAPRMLRFDVSFRNGKS
jgi:hypothetical protein